MAKRNLSRVIHERYGDQASQKKNRLLDQLRAELAPFFGTRDFGRMLRGKIAAAVRPDFLSEEAWGVICRSVSATMGCLNGKHVDLVGRKHVDAPLGKRDYHGYIHSKDWAKRRLALFEKRGRRCESCGETKGEIHIHHLTYENLGKELDMDLLILCRECHMIRHGKG